MAAFESRGHAVAESLKWAWRDNPPKTGVTAEDLEEVAPLLLKSGAGALGWWRIRQSPVRFLSAAKSLRNAYLRYAAQGLEQANKVATLNAVLQRERVRCILLKGLATSRFYPEPGLRPPGDIDLCVPPEDRQRTRAILDKPEYRGYNVDLEHAELRRFDDRSFEEFYLHSESIRIEGTEVRVLGNEDHLRFLCLHLLKHGGCRPLWLCDIAAVLEQIPRSFDWDRCLGSQKPHADWILCTIGLAQDVLKAQVANPPPRLDRLRLPRWLVNSLMKQWNAPDMVNLPLLRDQIRDQWRNPRGLVEALRSRWPNAIQATVDANGQFDDSMRLPFQLRNCQSRIMRTAAQFFDNAIVRNGPPDHGQKS